MSALPSPLKSPTLTSTQVTPVLQVSHLEAAKPEPLDKATHQSPPSAYRPTMSALPSPLESPTCTSGQVTPGRRASRAARVKPPPLAHPTHPFPALACPA